MTAAPSPEDVETPVGYVDLDRVRANARRVAEYATGHGLAWRPHVKSHKSTAVARIQLDAGARGLTVATSREAEVMASVTSDLLLAYPPVGASKLERLCALDPSVDLKVALDSTAVLEALARAARAAGRTFGVVVEADVGLGRVGVQTPEEVVAIAGEAAGKEGVTFRGLLFYPGHIRMDEARQGQPIAEVARRLARILDALGGAGLPPEVVSGGSTPTLWSSHRMPGITEIRSGSCIFFDREALGVGVAQRDHLAYTVLATVVSTAVPGQAVVDAGSKALSKEARGGEGFGFVLDRPGVLVKGLSEEHGVLDLSRTDWSPRVGDRVRIVPNHVCVSVNLQDALLAREGDTHRMLELEGRGRAPWTA
jgi:D-serine deaminase-like pyridoxal phosphate-dependent protein